MELCLGVVVVVVWYGQTSQALHSMEVGGIEAVGREAFLRGFFKAINLDVMYNVLSDHCQWTSLCPNYCFIELGPPKSKALVL